MVQMIVRAPKDLKESLQNEAQRMGFTLNALVLQILWEWDKSKTVEATKASQLPPPLTPAARLERPESEATQQCALY